MVHSWNLPVGFGHTAQEAPPLANWQTTWKHWAASLGLHNHHPLLAHPSNPCLTAVGADCVVTMAAAPQGVPVSAPIPASRSISLASMSSEGSTDSHLVEQEDIVALTQEVRAFKEALGKLRRILHPERDKSDALRVVAHERLGEVLRILRGILERYPTLQSTDLLVAAGTLIQQVKEHNYEEPKPNDAKEFCDAIDHLALTFSSRVSEYLMGDLDSNISLASSVSSKTKSCENVASDAETENREAKEAAEAALQGSSPQLDSILLSLEQGVELALHRAKLWAKYARDVMNYVEKRAQLEADMAKSLAKLAHTTRTTLKEEGFLPFQSIYITALDQEIENASTLQTTCSLITGHKYLEPLTARRQEHERHRKAIKATWHRELKRMHEAVTNLRKARAAYVQRQQEWEKAQELSAEKHDKRHKTADEAWQKAMEAETTYKACVAEANERHAQLLQVKAQVLQQVRELMLQCDQTMKAVTVAYFQLQHTVTAPSPVQYQTLCESSRLYEPGSQYADFIRRLPVSCKVTPPVNTSSSSGPFVFEPFADMTLSSSLSSGLERERKSNGSLSLESSEESPPSSSANHKFSEGPLQAWMGPLLSPSPSPSAVNVPNSGVFTAASDTDSLGSSRSGKSQDTSPTTSPMMPARRLLPNQSSDPLECFPSDRNGDDEEDSSNLAGGASSTAARRPCFSKAAATHTFRKLKTPSRCRECDSYVYFQGAECTECGLSCHKKCLETLALQCGHKRLPRKMNTFGVDLHQHLAETGSTVPRLLLKCVAEIDARGIPVKGLYRVSGVKSKVEKLCQAFENGAELVELTDVHPNVIANVLKLYLRQLPEPLLTYRLYPDFIRVAKDYPSNSEADTTAAVAELRELCKKLPKPHYATLCQLLFHLRRVADGAEANNMPASNLGIVFGPTLLRTTEGSASLSSLVDTVHQTRVIELLINNAHQVLDDSLSDSKPKANTNVAAMSSSTSFLSKVPVVRSLSFLESKKGNTTSGTSHTQQQVVTNTATMMSHHEKRTEEIILPGVIKSLTSDEDSISTPSSGLMSLTSDEDLPDFLLPDDSSGRAKSRSSLPSAPATPPKIFRGSLKDYHGLEGFGPALLRDDSNLGPRLSRPLEESSESGTSSIRSTDYPVETDPWSARRPVAKELSSSSSSSALASLKSSFKSDTHDEDVQHPPVARTGSKGRLPADENRVTIQVPAASQSEREEHQHSSRLGSLQSHQYQQQQVIRSTSNRTLVTSQSSNTYSTVQYSHGRASSSSSSSSSASRNHGHH